MAVGLESLSGCQLVHGQRDLALEVRARRHVGDLAAAHAQQMVMVLGEVLGQLEPGELVAGSDPAHESGRLQVGQMAIGRAARQLGEPVGDVADAHRVPGVTEQLDDGAASGRVALLDEAQTRLGDLVEGSSKSAEDVMCPPA